MNKAFQFLTLLALISTASCSKTGSPCSTESDCPGLHECLVQDSSLEKVCIHKPLFPITAIEVVGTFIVLTMNALLTAGGVGGGAAYVPYLMLLLKVSLSKAVSLAYVVVFGGGIGSLINTITLKNPKTKRFMINYDVNIIILPALMVGITIGLILQRILPPLVTNIVLLIVLAYSLFKNFTKLRINLTKEKAEQKEKTIQKENISPGDTKITVNAPSTITSTPTMTKDINGNEKDKAKEEDSLNADDEKSRGQPQARSNSNPENVLSQDSIWVDDNKCTSNEEKDVLYAKELKFPYHKILLLLINVLIIVVVGLIRGTKEFDSVTGVDWTCGWDFLWFAIGICLFSFHLVVCIYLVIKWQKKKTNAGYEFLPEEPFLKKQKIVELTLVSIFAGIVGAVVALGGAMIISPTLLDLGLPPAFSAVTTGLFLIFSMFNAMFTTILNGKLTSVELVWFLSLAVVMSYCSSKLVNWYVRKTGKQSTILILLCSITFLGFGCIVYNAVNGLVEEFKEQVTFTSVC